MALRRIGQVFVDLGYITDDQLEQLLDEQKAQPGELLGQVAMQMGLINDEQLAQALAEPLEQEDGTTTDEESSFTAIDTSFSIGFGYAF